MAAVAYPRRATGGRPDPLSPAPAGPLQPSARPVAGGAAPGPGVLASSVYRRRRALLLLALVPACLLLARVGAAVSGAGPGAFAGASVPASGQVYVVRPGDTVWSIAHRYDPGGDERPLVATITEELGGAALQPGQVLRIP